MIAVVVLGAGRSRRMGARNKLLLALPSGQTILRSVLEAAVAAQIGPVLLVTGHEAQAVAAQAAGLAVRCVEAADYAQGLSASLRAGVAAVPADCAGALICLSDMPFVTPDLLRALAAALVPPFDIVQPVFQGQPGNPVLWGRAHFAAMAELRGDEGARSLLIANRERLKRLDVGTDAVLQDIDTPEAYAAVSRA
nr:nucleotidyltransferase family protein [uncultured Acidocella sp.]